MTWLLQLINHATGTVPMIFNMLYLLLQRPVYCIGTTLYMMPFILKNKMFTPMTNFMSSSFWYPLARLTYGAYLSHSIFMLFRGYNTEKGVWASDSDAFLFFFAYLTLAFTFSLVMTLLVEIPCRRVYDEFIVKLRGSLQDRVSASFRSLKSSESKASMGSSED
jgi:peptidoglycan/LPS O-acetylase OafA/YrhL